MTQPTATVQCLRATNDANGNPRRLYHVTIAQEPAGDHDIRRTRTVAVYDISYTGTAFLQALARALWATGIDLVELRTVDVTPEEYRESMEIHQEATGGAEKAAFAVADRIAAIYQMDARAGGA